MDLIQYFATILERFTPIILNRLTTVAASPVVGAGIVRIREVTVEKFASLYEGEPYGDLYVVGDDESLPTASLPGDVIQTHKEKEFGRSIVIKPSDIGRYLGNVYASSGGVVDPESVDRTNVKQRLVTKALAQLTQMAVTRIGKAVYGALSGTIPATRKTGGSADLTFDITQGGSVTTAWSDPDAPILEDMQDIADFLFALSEPAVLSSGHTILSQKIMNYILRNKQVQALFPQFRDIFGLSEQLVTAQGSLNQYFGKIVKDDTTYKVDADTSARHLHEDYIVGVTGTQAIEAPAVDVYIAPTALDPKYKTAQAGTGFSLHVYDGLEDIAAPSYKVGELTLGVRGKIAVVVRKPKRIYRKKVLNI